MPRSGFALPEKDGVIDLDVGKNSLRGFSQDIWLILAFLRKYLIYLFFTVFCLLFHNPDSKFPYDTRKPP